MIKIKEGKPVKMPGLTSLQVEFPFNRDLVDIIKGSEVFYFNDKTKIWEVPTTSLAYLIDEFCRYDDIELTNYQEETIIYSKDSLTLDGIKSKPFEHQVVGAEYGINHKKFLLLDVPGLGKTLTIILMANHLYKNNKIDHCLIICGVNTLKFNWKNEIETHSNLTATILGQKVSRTGRISIGSIKDRVEHLNRKIDEFFVITNIETIRSNEIVNAIRKNKKNHFSMIVLDEAHAVKNAGATQSDNFLKLKDVEYAVCATGTMLLNNVTDCHLPLKFIGQDNSSASTFEHYYCVFDDKFGNKFMGYRNIDILKEQLSRCSIRRTKDLLNLPEKNVIVEYVDLNDKQKSFYTNILNGIVDEVDKVHISTKSLLAMFARLRQATELPSILTSEDIKSSKIDRAEDLVRQIVSNGEQVVVFSTFKEPIYALAKKISDLKISINTGDQKDEEINANMNSFQNKGQQVFLGTWQKCGTGITLNSASNMIFLSTPYTAGAFDQASDRVHRIGTKTPVFIYNLVCKETIDEKVLEIITDKKYIADFVIDDEISEMAVESLKKYIQDFRLEM